MRKKIGVADTGRTFIAGIVCGKTALHQDRPDPGPVTELDIAPLVPYHVGARDVDIQVLHGPVDQAGPRLPAVAIAGILGIAGSGMMRAIIDRVDPGALRPEHAHQDVRALRGPGFPGNNPGQRLTGS